MTNFQTNLFSFSNRSCDGTKKTKEKNLGEYNKLFLKICSFCFETFFTSFIYSDAQFVVIGGLKQYIRDDISRAQLLNNIVFFSQIAGKSVGTQTEIKVRKFTPRTFLKTEPIIVDPPIKREPFEPISKTIKCKNVPYKSELEPPIEAIPETLKCNNVPYKSEQLEPPIKTVSEAIKYNNIPCKSEPEPPIEANVTPNKQSPAPFNPLPPATQIRDLAGNYMFKCEAEDCGKLFRNYPSFESHRRLHGGFICEVCGKGFNKSSNLTRHMVTHSGEKPFKCNECRRGFTQRAHLKKHMNRIPEGEVTCQAKQGCEERFRCLEALKFHILTHNEDDESGASSYLLDRSKTDVPSHKRKSPYIVSFVSQYKAKQRYSTD